jgi:hypothetical protein
VQARHHACLDALFVQDNGEKGFVDLDFTIVLDETQLPELVHEQIHA